LGGWKALEKGKLLGIIEVALMVELSIEWKVIWWDGSKVQLKAN